MRDKTWLLMRWVGGHSKTASWRVVGGRYFTSEALARDAAWEYEDDSPYSVDVLKGERNFPLGYDAVKVDVDVSTLPELTYTNKTCMELSNAVPY